MDYDFDEELLGLAEGTSKRKKAKSSKRKRSEPEPEPELEEDDTASDMDMSSDSDVEPRKRNVKIRRQDGGDANTQNANPNGGDDDELRELYPLEGKYIDQEDRARIMSMSELDREALLGERAEKLAAQAARRELRQMVQRKEDRARQGTNAGSSDDDELTGARSAIRDRKTTGATREKREGLEKLRKSREEKGKKKEQKRRVRAGDSDDDAADYNEGSMSRRRAASSDVYSDDDDAFESLRKAATKDKSSRSNRKVEEKAGPTELSRIIVVRSKLAEFCNAPWFEEWIQGAWVRLGVGVDHGEPQYRICQVTGVRQDHRSYAFENTNTGVELELRHGKSVRFFTMESISNSPMQSREYARLEKQLSADRLSFPSVKEVEKTRQQLEKRKEFVMTEADVTAMLAKKGSRVNAAAGKARLLIQRDFARSTGDEALLAEVSEQLAQMEPQPPSSPSQFNQEQESEQDRMRRLNERNRATNREEIKRAEERAQDERRRQAAALARGDSSVKVDPSARVKTMTRLTYDRDATSRPSTPVASEKQAKDSAFDQGGSVHKIKAKGSKFEEFAAGRVEVDVDLDF